MLTAPYQISLECFISDYRSAESLAGGGGDKFSEHLVFSKRDPDFVLVSVLNHNFKQQVRNCITLLHNCLIFTLVFHTIHFATAFSYQCCFSQRVWQVHILTSSLLTSALQAVAVYCLLYCKTHQFIKQICCCPLVAVKGHCSTL